MAAQLANDLSCHPSIVEVLKNKIALWISNRANDWTAENAMIASNVGHKIWELV